MLRELKFKLLCERYRDDAYRYARSMLGGSMEAEDALQEVLLRLWKHLDEVNVMRAKGWILRTTRNYCYDQLRRRNCVQIANVEAEMLDTHQSGERSPDRAAETSLLGEQIEAALQRLPPVMREVFVMYEMNGLRYREIGEQLGMTVPSVKISLSRARKKLQLYLCHHELRIANEA